MAMCSGDVIGTVQETTAILHKIMVPPQMKGTIKSITGGDFTVDAFKVVKRGGAVISLSGPPDRDFARRMGAGLVVRVAVWLMSRKVYAAAEAAGASYCWFFTEPSGDQLREIAALVECGAIKPVIDREFAFEQLPAALAYLERGRARGKVVLKVR